MRLSKKYLASSLFLLVSLFSIKGFSQNYLPQQITTQQGLPDNDVYAILKDTENNLWVGTNNGLSLIKGQQISNFKKKEGLAHNACRAIVQDQLGQIWIGTFGGGLSLYKKGKFQNFSTKQGLASNKIRKLFLKNNDLYIGTTNGFSKINIITKKVKTFEIKDKRTGVVGLLRDFEILGIIEVNGFIVFNTHSHGIYILKNDVVSVLNKSQYISFSIFKNKDSIYLSKNGFIENGKSILRIAVKSFLKGKSNFETVKSSSTIIWDYIKTNDNRIFAAGEGVQYDIGGLFEIKNQAVQVNKRYGIKSSKIWSLFYDKNTNQVFVGTLGDGLYIVDLGHTFYKKSNTTTLGYEKNALFKNVILYPDGIFIETSTAKQTITKNQLYYLIKNKILKLTDESQQKCDGYGGNYKRRGFLLISIQLVEKTILINTSYGLLKLDYKSKKAESTLYLSSLETYKFLNKKQLFWYYPYYSLFYYPDVNDTEKFIIFFERNSKTDPKKVQGIYFTPRHKFFLSRTNGIYYLRGTDLKEFKFFNLLPNVEITSSYQVSKHQIMFSTIDGAVFVLNDSTPKIKIQKSIAANLIEGNTIYKLLNYKKNNLVFTEKGINIINSTSKKQYLIDAEMGISYKNIHSATIYDNLLYLATDEGTYEINIESFLANKNQNKPPYSIEKFLVNNETPTLIKKFEYDENKFQIQLGTSFLLYPKKLFFQYKVKGIKNANWSKWTQNNTIDLLYLPPGNYEVLLQYKDLSNGNFGQQSLKKFEISPPYWQNFYFVMLSILLFGIVSRSYLTRRKIREIEKLIYEKRIAESRMEALQSQMNPHFVFNSLNVIQNFVIQNDIENSINYINTFSKLMRITLEHSSELVISIDEEIQFLKLYVAVQNIRFNNNVQFKINISKELDKTMKKIPPMLIQPLLENCFEHAFNDTVSKPKITLDIYKYAGKILVSVTDNGIGIKENKFPKRESKALKLVQERLELLDSENELKMENGATGMRVSLSFDFV